MRSHGHFFLPEIGVQLCDDLSYNKASNGEIVLVFSILQEDCRHGNEVHKQNVAITLFKKSLTIYQYIPNFGNMDH